MGQQISIQKAAANVLAAYITSNLQAQNISDAQVSSRWPSASKVLPKRAVTVLLAGEMEKELVQATVVARQNVTSTTAEFTTTAFSARLPMQIDTWAQTDVERDDMVARLDDMLNQGAAALPGVFNPDVFAEGVILQFGANLITSLGTGNWQGTASFLFDSFVEDDSPDAVARSEFRSRARGEASFIYTQTRLLDRLLSPGLKLKAHEIGAVGSPPATQLWDIYTITNTGKGFVYSTGP